MAKVHNVNGKHRHDRIASAEGTFPAMRLSPLSNSGTATLRFAEPCELVELFFSGSTLAEARETVVYSQSRAPMRTAGFSALDAKAAGANKCHPAAPLC